MSSSSSSSAPASYDRLADLRALDATKSGVRGLVAGGVAAVPRVFLLPPGDRIPTPPPREPQPQPLSTVPVVDLSRSGERGEAVEAVPRASAEWGFFQVVGHGVPQAATASVLKAVAAFHEEEEGGGEDGRHAKARLYSREPRQAVKYHCNFDLYQSRVANWRDTLYCRMAPDPPTPDDLPGSCRDELFEYANHVMTLGNTLFELLSEALGLSPTYLADIECNKGQILLCHYYPPCPEPELAIGTSPHSDSGFLTVLLQDHIGGLQILHDGEWVDVAPIPGALVVNIGDLLQLITNDSSKASSIAFWRRTRDPGFGGVFLQYPFPSISTKIMANQELLSRIILLCTGDTR
ncbi:1-aminocyclopropane-1-carboxylate oxidase [Ananas comosus]|uniref:1-aminocyclopropane-1-carboxylate oxidase n=1 Tax=Ananas comosus TaxID=4615 RepID=A0A199VPN1_ANACO|nr:1-aminocyclopropane-1-carboxylate oxidase [Ananas comosus]